MKKLAFAITAVAVAFSGLALAEDGGPFASEIKARQGIMRYRAVNIGVLAAMAKGETPYDAAQAKVAANALLASATLDESMLWPAGSDHDANPASSALPAIWASDSDIGAKVDGFTQAATTMASAAGTDLASLQGAMEALGGACGACHKAFRAPSN